MDNGKNKKLLKTLMATALINCMIGAALFFWVQGMEPFLDIFIIAQSIGLSICFFVMTGVRVAQKKQWPDLVGIIIGMGLGILSGCILSWGFLTAFGEINLGFFIKEVVPKVIFFGFAFGIPIIYFFFSREKIIESEKIIQQEKIKRLTIEKESAMTHLRMLQAQIEPHFLFNTLANISSLLEIDVAAAKKMLATFNEYLRICLERTRQDMITLSQELELVRKYLEIFKIRMGERLSYHIDDLTCQPDLDFPPLIIQPLVENSIKYGLEPKTDGGHIEVCCQVKESCLEIMVSDTGDGLDLQPNQAGIGINNVSQRLEGIYGNRATLAIKENHPNGVIIKIKVPL